MTRVTSDVETLNELFSSGVVTVFGDVFTLVAIMGMMLVIDWRLALVAFAVIPLVWLTARLFRRHVREAFRDIRVRLARLNSLPAGAPVRDAGRAALRPRGGHGARGSACSTAITSRRTSGRSRSTPCSFPAIEVLTAVALALLLWYGGLRVLDGTLTVGVLAAFIQLTRRFFQPLQDLSREVQPAAERDGLVGADLRAARRAGDGARAGHAPCALPRPVRGEVAFEDVWFRYSPDGPVGAPGRIVHAPRPGRRSRWWGTPARGRRRSSACCSASTTPSAAASPSTAWTSASSRPPTCAGSSASCSRISSCSPAISSTT